MTLTLMLIANAVLDVALLLCLAYMMSHPRKLTPHVSQRFESARAARRRRRALRPAHQRRHGQAFPEPRRGAVGDWA